MEATFGVVTDPMDVTSPTNIIDPTTTKIVDELIIKNATNSTRPIVATQSIDDTKTIVNIYME
jgi:hypothetical protein